eukprot:scaffold238401_cov30-Tisochrysis_lutea.AAC.2
MVTAQLVCHSGNRTLNVEYRDVPHRLEEDRQRVLCCSQLRGRHARDRIGRAPFATLVRDLLHHAVGSDLRRIAETEALVKAGRPTAAVRRRRYYIGLGAHRCAGGADARARGSRMVVKRNLLPLPCGNVAVPPKRRALASTRAGGRANTERVYRRPSEKQRRHGKTEHRAGVGRAAHW